MTMMSIDLHESGDFRRLEQSLMARFSPPLPAEEVERCLMEGIAMFEGARVQTYLWVLIERAVTDRLRAATHQSVGGA